MKFSMPLRGSSMNECIRVETLSVRIGEVEVLKDVSFCVNRGEFVGLIGPNGAGKSTLVKVLIGEITDFKGNVRVEGRIGYLPQVQTVNREVPIDVRTYVVMPLYAKKKRLAPSEWRRVDDTLQRVGLAAVKKRHVGTLSGGELQRASLARALIAEPDILILDEPEAGVDQMGKARFYDLLDELRRERELTVFMVSHDVGLVFERCTTIMCLNKTLHCHRPTERVNPEEIKSFFSDFDLWIRGREHYEREHNI